ncbi:carboxypeptidase-like regulatory domain-containing protein [Hymenobacter nivis]|uniref:Carboxypeptidase-like regulatory domain-containing protein n=1 Tax=Hymenobacter nivis TaxID=1850093 RepID=A0A502GZG8_9BACT|nr:carboxypeptidase-like regulatory domain-containing protein [Hymenobacter nivis]TPG67481.1 carboxypeptidase-like regulatory domain-containing protein [Hymenobacter nivis]
MNILRLFLISCLCLGALGAARAQGKLSGVVQDSVTHEPLAFSSVFLANTTLGVTTNELGKFEFAKVPTGTYSVVGSYVGYRLAKQVITITNAPQQITLALAATGNQLAEVVVESTPNDPKEYQKFTDQFLGRTAFSDQSHIVNPKDVIVSYNDSTKDLTARSRKFVQIDNDALGYHVKYYGMRFSSNDEDGSLSFYGEPVFEEMTPRDERQQRQWAANRAAAYNGSFNHFLKSVYDNRVVAEGFLTQQVRVVVNNRFDLTDSLRRTLLTQRPNGPFSKPEQDSLRKWSRAQPVTATVYPEARPIDSIRQVSADGRHVYLRFTGELQVAHFGEAPDPKYGRPMSPLGATAKPYPALRQVSRLRLQGQEAEIQANGSLVNPFDVSAGEYWAFEKIGEFLPLNYVPPVTLAPAPAPAPARAAAPARTAAPTRSTPPTRASASARP